MVNLFSKFKGLFFDKKIKNVEEKTINLPIEVQIDVLKCLNYDQLFSLQQVNYHFNYLIEQNKWILALKELDCISTIYNEDYTFVIDPIPDVVHEPIDDDLMVKWQYAIDKKIPMFWSGDPGEFPEGCTVFLSSLNKKYFKLTLPNYRKNIEEMKIVRFWLEQLFRCAFRKNFGVIFNPEMIKILFQNNKNIPLKFNIQVYNTRFHASYHKNEIEYMRDHLFISKEIYLRFHFMSNIEKQNGPFLDLNLLLLHSQWASIVWTDDVDDFLNLYNLIINFIEMSKFCSEVELYIIFSGLSYLKWKIEAANIVHLENHACACLYENILNPKIKFFNVFVYENPNDDIIDHIIIRKMQPGWPYN